MIWNAEIGASSGERDRLGCLVTASRRDELFFRVICKASAQTMDGFHKFVSAGRRNHTSKEKSNQQPGRSRSPELALVHPLDSERGRTKWQWR